MTRQRESREYLRDIRDLEILRRIESGDQIEDVAKSLN